MAVSLGGLFDDSPDPLYVVDDRRAIIFANRALAEWMGVAVEQLVGKRVEYHSRSGGDDETSAPGMLAGLCPPPECFTGRELVGHVSSMSRDGRLRHRCVRFVPLGGQTQNSADCVGVTAFVGPDDLSAAQLADMFQATDADRNFLPDQLHLAVRRFRRGRSERYSFDRLIGNSPATRLARQQADLAAQSTVNVLIIGPVGSGRTHTARTIHYRSAKQSSTRQQATRPESLALVLLDATLVTDDVMRRTLDVVAASTINSGLNTLLITDADQLSAEHQATLAQFAAAQPPHVRIIATAQQTPEELAHSGVLRDDLLCALATLSIRMPPLAQRLDDLPILAQMFLEDLNAAGEHQVGGLATPALDLLAAYTWPGQLDELAEALAVAHRQCQTAWIQPDDLPAKFRHADDLLKRPLKEEETIVLDEYLARVETELINRAMSRAGGNKAKAARLLGMTRPRLYRRLVQLGLVADDDQDAAAD